MEAKPTKHELTIADLLDEDQPQQAECSTRAASAAPNNTAIPFPFLPLYSQYSFAQRLKSTIPFSKLFFSNHIKPLPQTKAAAKQPAIQHDQEQCMFLVELDTQGRTAAICYLPTRVKNVIEVYHTEIPARHRHKGIGDRLVKACLLWAKESGTFVIPTCSFVRRHLDYNGFQNYDLVIVKNEQEAQNKKTAVEHF
ncbi:hypothetical protein MBANPS3_002154 [Mucor bainieri]